MTNGADRGVTRADRMRDGIAVAILVGAASLYAYAYLGMQRLAAHPVDSTKLKMANFLTYEHLWQLSRIGRVMIFVGVIAVVMSALMHARRPPRS
ncbi:MAG: hypothetical protein ABJD07_08930 [Gemmatimonadaceae bacterium]